MKLFEGFSNKYAMYANLEEKLNVMKEKVRNFFKKKFYQNLNCKKKYFVQILHRVKLQKKI